MKIKLHHVNLCSSNVSAMEAFYRTVLDLTPEPGLNESRTPEGGYPGKVAFVTDGITQLHLAEKDFGVSFRTLEGMLMLARIVRRPTGATSEVRG